MVGKTRLELATPASQTRCSAKLSYFPIMARPIGVEPTTLWSVVRYSIQLSYRRIIVMVRVKGLEPLRPKTLDPKSSVSAYSTTPAHGAVDRNRTYDPLITSQLLCLLSYNGWWSLVGHIGLEPMTSCL